MKAFLPLLARRPLLLAVLALPAAFGCGCTSTLWDSETFAHYYRPASPVDLRLSYSKDQQDLLVQYSESKDGDTNSRVRCYWLEHNTRRVNGNRKPHFVSAKTAGGLTTVPVGEGTPQPSTAEVTQLYARAADDSFTLYSGTKELDPYKLPVYTGSSQRVKQVLLTPFAVAVDATIIGAALTYYYGPEIFFPALTRK